MRWLRSCLLRSRLLLSLLAIVAPLVAHPFVTDVAFSPIRGWQLALLRPSVAESRLPVESSGGGEAVGENDTSAAASAPPDALVVLGCGVNHYSGEPSSIAISRVRRAALVACTRGVSLVLFSGGLSASVPIGFDSEAAVFARQFEREWARTGCATQKQPTLVKEEWSTSTRENARNSLGMLLAASAGERIGEQSGDKERNFAESRVLLANVRRMLLVTSRFHELRSLRVFRRVEAGRQAARGDSQPRFLFGLPQSEDEPTPSSEDAPLEPHADGRQLDFLRECAAIVYYAIRGWI